MQARDVGGKPDGSAWRPLETSSQGIEPAPGAAGGTLNSASGKTALRSTARLLRSAIPLRLRSRLARQAARAALNARHLRRARCVALYLDHGSELPTETLIHALRKRGVRILVPWIEQAGGRMRFVHLLRSDPLRRGRFGIRRPRLTRRVPALRIDVVVLPLLAYDFSGQRLGSGGGYYDRWLDGRGARPHRLGLAFACQRLSGIPAEPWDVSLHAVATERGLRPFHRRR